MRRRLADQRAARYCALAVGCVALSLLSAATVSHAALRAACIVVAFGNAFMAGLLFAFAYVGPCVSCTVRALTRREGGPC